MDYQKTKQKPLTWHAQIFCFLCFMATFRTGGLPSLFLFENLAPCVIITEASLQDKKNAQYLPEENTLQQTKEANQKLDRLKWQDSKGFPSSNFTEALISSLKSWNAGGSSQLKRDI